MDDEQMRREIAERLGWKVKIDHTFNDGEDIMWKVDPPSDYANCRRAYINTSSRGVEDDVWKEALWRVIPNWPEDIMAALELFEGRYVRIIHIHDMWHVSTNYLIAEGDDAWLPMTTGSDLAHPLCEAWIARQQKNEELHAAGRL